MARRLQPSPVVIIDTREKTPWHIEAFPVERAALPVGDYGIRGFSDWRNPAFIVERKTPGDLVSSLIQGQERFFKEVEKLRRFNFAALVVEAPESIISDHLYRSAAKPASILALVDSFRVRAGVHVIYADDPDDAARRFERLARQFCRGVVKDFDRLRAANLPCAGTGDAPDGA